MVRSMACGGIDLQNIYLWLSLSGILLGGGFSFLAAPTRRRSLTFASILFSAAVLSALCGIIIAGFNTISSSSILMWFGAAVVVGYAAFLYWKVLGIPLFFLLIIMVISLYYSLFDWSCVSPGTELSRVVILSENEGSIRIQYDDSSGSRRVKVLPGRSAVPVIEKIVFPEYFFIIRERGLFMFHGFRGEGQDPGPAFDPGPIFSVLLKLPGIVYGPLEADAFRPYPSIDYSLSLDNEGRPVVSRLIE
ncbi:MAG: hypothetical protein JEZ04_21275 [Spirochaetales bacterium]|nr:hypothetical protein [Spirochaetales bacterium]